MWKIMSRVRVKNVSFFVILILVIGGKCAVSPPTQQQTNQTNNTRNKKKSELKWCEIVFHQSRIIWNYVEQIPDPIEVKDVKIVDSGRDKGDLRIEIFNKSDKPIIATMFVLEPPSCDNFAMHGGLNIGWGDVELIGKPADVVRPSKWPIVKSGETSFVVYKRKELESFLRPEDYKGCELEKSYSGLGISFVRFKDGTEWRFKDEVDEFEKNQ